MPGNSLSPPTSTHPAPRLAGVVVNYNYESYVCEAVQSLLDQTSPFDEVVVVDDGSTDGSLASLASFGDRIQVISKPNGGHISAVWAAVAATQAEYLYVLDSDDSADPGLVERIAPLLIERPVKIQFQLHSMDAAGQPIDSVFPTFANGYDSTRMIADNARLGFYICAPTSGNVFRRSFLAELSGVGLNEREFYDGVPAQLAPWFGTVASLNEPLANYRVHGSSDSQWGKPTVELLRRETQRFADRWVEVDEVLRSRGFVPPDPRLSAYVLERRLMRAVLDGRRPRFADAVNHARRVTFSGLAKRQAIALAVWGFGLAILPNARAQRLVASRRAAQGRGRLMSLVARLMRRSRRPGGPRSRRSSSEV